MSTGRGSNAALQGVCPQGHNYRSAIYSRTGTGTGCPECATWATEKAVLDVVLGYCRDAEKRTVSTPWGGSNHADCDVVVESRRLIIEYDGVRWHQDKAEMDTLKTLALIESGWRVARIREAMEGKQLPFLSAKDPNLYQVHHAWRTNLPGIRATIAKIFEWLDGVDGRSRTRRSLAVHEEVYPVIARSGAGSTNG